MPVYIKLADAVVIYFLTRV